MENLDTAAKIARMRELAGLVRGHAAGELDLIAAFSRQFNLGHPLGRQGRRTEPWIRHLAVALDDACVTFGWTPDDASRTLKGNPTRTPAAKALEGMRERVERKPPFPKEAVVAYLEERLDLLEACEAIRGWVTPTDAHYLDTIRKKRRHAKGLLALLHGIAI